MKKFLKNITAFVIVVLLLAIAFDMMISKGLERTERGHFYMMNKLMHDTINADVVVLGNSRAVFSYHPTILDTILGADSYNLGVSGQPFGVSYLRWQLYKRRNNNPQLLIVNMDYAELDVVTNGFEREQYYPYMKDTLVRPYLDLYGFSWMEKNIPMYRYRGDYKLMVVGLSELFHIHHYGKGEHIKGYFNKPLKWEGTALEAVLQQGRIQGEHNPRAVELLDKLLATATQEGIKVVFVYAPMVKRLKENLEEGQSMAAYQELSTKYGVPMIDLSEMDFCSDTTCFADANHVNSKGAERFTIALAHRIDSLGLLRN